MTWLGILGGLYAAWCVLVYAMQDRMLFPRWVPGHPVVESPLEGVERVWITAADGSRVEGWFLAAPSAAPALPPTPPTSAPAVIFAHGNAELIDDNLALAAQYHALGFAVLLPEYRGYGRSEGTPSQTTIMADFEMFHAWLAARPDVDPARLVYHGRSVGGAVVAQLAARHPPHPPTPNQPAALILQSSVTSVASFSWRFGVPPLLASSPFRTDRVIGSIGCPILIMHGADDTIVPPSHGRRLHALATGSVYREMPGDHNDFPRDERAYWRTITEFLRAAGLATEAPTSPEPPR